MHVPSHQRWVSSVWIGNREFKGLPARDKVTAEQNAACNFLNQPQLQNFITEAKYGGTEWYKKSQKEALEREKRKCFIEKLGQKPMEISLRELYEYFDGLPSTIEAQVKSSCPHRQIKDFAFTIRVDPIDNSQIDGVNTFCATVWVYCSSTSISDAISHASSSRFCSTIQSAVINAIFVLLTEMSSQRLKAQ